MTMLQEGRVHTMKLIETFIVLASVASLLAGCAGVSGGPSSSSGSSSASSASSASGRSSAGNSVSDEALQALANQATKAMGVGPVYIDVRPGRRGGMYACREMRIEMTTEGDVRWLLAHELSHHIMRHCGNSYANELEANAMAVRVFEVWGLTPEQAQRRVVLAVYALRYRPVLTVHDFCAELRDLMARYPNVPDPRKAGECGA